MIKAKIIFFCLIFFKFCLNASAFKEDEPDFTAYEKPLSLSDEEWENVKPYLLPFDHPLKKRLDKLFSASRVTRNAESIKNAGFYINAPARFSRAIVSRHRYLKGYYFKFYNDEQQIEIESKQWVDRAFEARSVKKVMVDLKIAKYFKVPKKWIYLIPDAPISDAPYPKHFVLVAQKIDILKGRANRLKWKTEVTPKLLDAVWRLTQHEGLVDSLVAHNLPFTEHNKLALIDLEQHHRWPVPFERLKTYLNAEMQDYWTRLIEKGGP